MERKSGAVSLTSGEPIVELWPRGTSSRYCKTRRGWSRRELGRNIVNSGGGKDTRGGLNESRETFTFDDWLADSLVSSIVAYKLRRSIVIIPRCISIREGKPRFARAHVRADIIDAVFLYLSLFPLAPPSTDVSLLSRESEYRVHAVNQELARVIEPDREIILAHGAYVILCNVTWLVYLHGIILQQEVIITLIKDIGVERERGRLSWNRRWMYAFKSLKLLTSSLCAKKMQIRSKKTD